MNVENETVNRTAGLSAAKRALLEKRLHGGFKSMPKSPLIPRRAAPGPVPLSYAQQRLWFLHQLDPESPLYNMPMAVLLNGQLNVDALRQAIMAIMERHEILRMRFEAQDGNPVQTAVENAALDWSIHDLRSLTNGKRDAEIQRLLHEEARRPFDLTKGPLLRATLLPTEKTEHVLLVTMHHIASDGWSWAIFLHELAVLYESHSSGTPVCLPELQIQYADFASWQRHYLQGELLEKQLAYWKRQLAGAPDYLELPTDRSRPPMQTFRGHCESLELPAHLIPALHKLNRQEGVTLFMTLLAAFMTLLHRHTRQSDLLVGTPFAGRTQKETEDLIGFFINTLVLRCDLGGNPTFRELLRRVRETTIEAFTYHDLPFEKLVEHLRPERSSSHSPLIQVMFVLQNAPTPGRQLANLTMTPMEVDTRTAKFDLTLAVEEDANSLNTAIEYNTDLFDTDTILLMLQRWRVLLEGIAADPDRHISELPLLPEAERHQLTVEWNATRTDYPRNKTIQQLFEEQAEKTPAAVAVICGGEQLTYQALNKRANQLAHRLQQLGIGSDSLAGICMERSLEMVIGLLGILKAGGAYVSLDAAYPKERLKLMLEDTQPQVILTGNDQVSCLPACNAHILSLNEWNHPDENVQAVANTNCHATAESLAYVSFTSGSTGRPKGVCVPHRGVVRLVKETDYARFSHDETFLQLAPIAFDASTFEIWGALLNGARLVLFPPHNPALSELGEFIQAQRITTLWLTAGLFHQMVEDQLDNLRGLHQLLAGGDVLSVPHVKKALEKLDGCRLINGYGPTENTTFTCCHQLTTANADVRSIPIGRPIANTQVYILDDHLEPVPGGIPGELYIGGDGLARGYLNRPELTAERFVSNPFSSEAGARLYKTGDLVRWLPDGSIEFLGRVDLQVKIRGFRIELGEIETVIGQHPGIRECAVVAWMEPPGEKRLVAYVVAKQQPAPGIGEMRCFLAEKLPDYMLPSAFVFLDGLPLSPTGKVDRQALRSPGTARPELEKKFIPPRDYIEQRLAKIWEDVLNIRPVGVADKFFDLGGHSLLAVRLLTRIEKAFDKKLALATVFQASTIEELANIIRGQTDRTPRSSLVEIQADGSRPPLFLVHGVGGGMFWGYSNLARHLGPEQPLYAFKSRGLDGQEEFDTIEGMAAQYVADLRSFQPQGPYFLGGYCFGGNVAYEMARQLEQQGEKVALLLLMNCAPTNPAYMQVRVTPAWIWRFLCNLTALLGVFCQWKPEVRRNFVLWKLRAWQKRIIKRFAIKRSAPEEFDAENVVDLSTFTDDQRKLWATHIRALNNYQTGPYTGEIILFRSRAHQFFCSFADDFGWGECTGGGVTVQIVPGAHESILEEPHVSAVAEGLTACLLAAEAKGKEKSSS